MSVNLEVIMEHTLTFDRMLELPKIFNKIKKLSDDCYWEAFHQTDLNEYLSKRESIDDNNYQGNSWFINDEELEWVDGYEESDEFSGYELECALGFFKFNKRFCQFHCWLSRHTVATEYHLIEMMRIIGQVIGAKLALYGPDNLFFPLAEPFENMMTLQYQSIEDLIFIHQEKNGCVPDSYKKRIYEEDSWYFIDFFED